VLASAEFARCIDEPIEFLGPYLMEGVEKPEEVFGSGGFCSS
jgi:hypothetical protein